MLELLTADYTFVNERLARHYGIPGVYGSQFRRVAVTDEARRACSGHGSILTVTSHAQPHVAGAARQVDAREPARHAAAAAAAERAAAQGARTAEQAADDARADGGAPRAIRCAPAATADGSARLRAGEFRRRRRVAGRRTARTPIDASSQLADGTKVDGVSQRCARRCVAGPERFVRHADREAADLRARPRLGRIRHAGGARDRRAAPRRSNYRFSSIVLGIVNSVPFQMRIKPFA